MRSCHFHNKITKDCNFCLVSKLSPSPSWLSCFHKQVTTWEEPLARGTGKSLQSTVHKRQGGLRQNAVRRQRLPHHWDSQGINLSQVFRWDLDWGFGYRLVRGCEAEDPARLRSDSQFPSPTSSKTEIINVCYFKLLSLGVICYMAQLKNLPANAGDADLLPGLRRSPKGGKNNPFQ